MYSDTFHISKLTVPDSRKFFCAKSKHKYNIILIDEMQRKATHRYGTLIFKTKIVCKDYLQCSKDLFLKVDAPGT